MTPPTDRPGKTSGRNPVATALWANAALLAVIALVLLNRAAAPPRSCPPRSPRTSRPSPGGAGVFVMPGQFKENVWGCYLLDVDNKTLCAYQYFPGDKKLRLAAARCTRTTSSSKSSTPSTSPREIKSADRRQNAGAAGDPRTADSRPKQQIDERPA